MVRNTCSTPSSLRTPDDDARTALTFGGRAGQDIGMKELARIANRARTDQMPLLLVAAVVVGIAIAMDGDGRRIVNGIGGILWIVAAFRILVQAAVSGVTVRQYALVGAVILVLSYLIRPVDPLWAAIGFGWGGILVGWVGRERGSKLGALLGALWLPAHLLIAIGHAIVRNLRDEPATLRSDPPPTAVLVPLIMVFAAWMFALLTSDWRAQKDAGGLLQPRSPIRPR